TRRTAPPERPATFGRGTRLESGRVGVLGLVAGVRWRQRTLHAAPPRAERGPADGVGRGAADPRRGARVGPGVCRTCIIRPSAGVERGHTGMGCMARSPS